MKTPLTEAELDRIEAEVTDELPDLLQRAARRNMAIAENTLSGQLRRALISAQIRQEHAAVEAGITTRQFADWMTGDAPLPSTALDRLAALVHHQLQPAP